jgi:nicotinamidase-related amidase
MIFMPTQPSALSPTVIDPADSILLVIDLQEGFLKKISPDRRDAIIEHCRFVVEVATRLAIPLFSTVEDPVKNGMTTERVRTCFDHSMAQREKSFFGLCSQDNLREAILAQPKRTAVLVGMDTDVCVLQSAVGLRAEGFRSVIVSDATEAPGASRGIGRGDCSDAGALLRMGALIGPLDLCNGFARDHASRWSGLLTKPTGASGVQNVGLIALSSSTSVQLSRDQGLARAQALGIELIAARCEYTLSGGLRRSYATNVEFIGSWKKPATPRNKTPPRSCEVDY